jgi:hypothetical protein
MIATIVLRRREATAILVIPMDTTGRPLRWWQCLLHPNLRTLLGKHGTAESGHNQTHAVQRALERGEPQFP